MHTFHQHKGGIQSLAFRSTEEHSLPLGLGEQSVLRYDWLVEGV
jgi:hypothetical protein